VSVSDEQHIDNQMGLESLKFYSIKLCTTSEAYLIDVFRVFLMVDV
jgi:hypothetical protein